MYSKYILGTNNCVYVMVVCKNDSIYAIVVFNGCMYAIVVYMQEPKYATIKVY